MKQTKNVALLTAIMILLSVLFSVNVFAGSAQSISSPNLRIVADEVSPEPVEPGQDLTVKIRLTNDGGADARGVSLKLDAGYPFFLKSDSDNFDVNRSLCVGCSIENTYYLIVDANAKSGLYPLSFSIYRDGTVVDSDDTIDIKVVGKPDVVLETDTIDTDVSSGDKFTIDFKAKNIGTGIARNIKIIPQSDYFVMMGSNFGMIDEINPGESSLYKSEFIVKDTLVPDTYKFSVKIEYVDEQGNSYDSDFDIGVNVLNRAALDFQSVKINPSMPTLVDEVHMEGIIENTGSGDADKVTVELISPAGKSYKAFIGQLKSDDDAPFYFDVKPESLGMQKATLKVSYYDDFGFHSFNTTMEKEVRKPTNNLIAVVIVLVIVVFGLGYYFIRKKK